MKFKKNKIKASPVKDTFNEPSSPFGESKIYSIAVVLDNKVQDIIRAEIRLAAMLLSDPILVDITEDHSHPRIGWEYNKEDGTFLNKNEHRHD
jgi:hypothetical protein